MGNDWTHWLVVGYLATVTLFLLTAAAWPGLTSKPKHRRKLPQDRSVTVVQVPYDWSEHE
jgi:hypothetical protein